MLGQAHGDLQQPRVVAPRAVVATQLGDPAVQRADQGVRAVALRAVATLPEVAEQLVLLVGLTLGGAIGRRGLRLLVRGLGLGSCPLRTLHEHLVTRRGRESLRHGVASVLERRHGCIQLGPPLQAHRFATLPIGRGFRDALFGLQAGRVTLGQERQHALVDHIEVGGDLLGLQGVEAGPRHVCELPTFVLADLLDAIRRGAQRAPRPLGHLRAGGHGGLDVPEDGRPAAHHDTIHPPAVSKR